MFSALGGSRDAAPGYQYCGNLLCAYTVCRHVREDVLDGRQEANTEETHQDHSRQPRPVLHHQTQVPRLQHPRTTSTGGQAVLYTVTVACPAH